MNHNQNTPRNMKKQKDRQSNGTKSESPVLKDTISTTSRRVQPEEREGSITSDGARELIRARAYRLFDHPEAREGSIASEGTRELINARAYRLFELRGRQPGHAVDDWLQAEREILRPSPAA